MLFTRSDIVDFSIKIGCMRELSTKGMVTSVLGDVVCIAALTDFYQNGIYYMHNIKSPTDVYYCGVYGVNAPHRLAENDHETRKNIAVTKTDGKTKFVYFFEKISCESNLYFFHGRYKYLGHTIVQSKNPEHKEEILFHLLFVDKPF